MSAMSNPATPTKRVLTEDARKSLTASRIPLGNFVSDDLTARLQNLGSRVRKSVNEGYATQRYGGIASVTPTPYSSPLKSASASTSPRNAHIFRSANDTLLDVYSSPSRPSDTVHPVSPSRKKRRHAEIDLEEEDSGSSSFGTRNGNLAIPGMEATSEDEDIMIITDGSPKHRPSRPIRPLKLSGRTHRPPDAPSSQPCIAKSCFSSLNSEPHTEERTRVASDRKDMFNQPF